MGTVADYITSFEFILEILNNDKLTPEEKNKMIQTAIKNAMAKMSK